LGETSQVSWRDWQERGLILEGGAAEQIANHGISQAKINVATTVILTPWVEQITRLVGSNGKKRGFFDTLSPTRKHNQH
jgi:hypothetical protein